LEDGYAGYGFKSPLKCCCWFRCVLFLYVSLGNCVTASVRWKMVLKTAVGPVFRWKIVRIVLFSPHPRTARPVVDTLMVRTLPLPYITCGYFLGVDSEFMNFDLKLINNPVVS